MILTCASTGSKSGNTHVLQTSGGKYIILDCGAAYKDILRACRYNVRDTLFAIQTHSHADHLRPSTQKELSRHGIPIYTNLEPEKRHVIDDIGIIPFIVPHTNGDGSECPCMAYVIETGGERLLYLTDWMYCRYRLTALKINHFLIAVNYTDLPDEITAKERHVLTGHASLETAIEFLKTNMTDACKSIIACHLSEENADEEKIMRELREIAPENVKIAIAKKGVSIKL